MGKIIPLVSFRSTSQLGSSSGDPGGWCVTGILMGCPSHLSWLFLMQRSSGEPSHSLRLSQLLTISSHSLTWHLLPESSSRGSGLFQCHDCASMLMLVALLWPCSKKYRDTIFFLFEKKWAGDGGSCGRPCSLLCPPREENYLYFSSETIFNCK